MKCDKSDHLTPLTLAKAMIWPFVWIPGGMGLMLGLAALTAGVDPAEFAADFMADSALALSTLALKCALIWALYSALYFLWTWPHRPLFNPLEEFPSLHPALCRLVCSWTARQYQPIVAVESSWLVVPRRHSFAQGVRWLPGVHPHLE